MHRLLIACLVLASGLAHGAEQLDIVVTHELDAPRPAETIGVPWTAIANVLPDALPDRLEVKDTTGHLLPYQVIPESAGIRSELLFQHDFVKGEKSAAFTIARSEHAAPTFPSAVFARQVPERLDDFAWENDKIAFRIYGPALAAPAAPGSHKEVLVSSGIDVWFKRVPYPIIDRWYRKGRYHEDEGEGLDMYGVGATRGLGGTGVWDGRQLHVGRNYARWKMLANGPIRTVFEIEYDAWDGGSVAVSEIKRFTLDAGSPFCRVDSRFTFGGRPELTAAIGLNRHPTEHGRETSAQSASLLEARAMVQWFTQKSDGDFGTAVILLDRQAPAFAEDESNLLLLAKIRPGMPQHYMIGATWSKASAVRSLPDWQTVVAAAAARERSPVKVSWTSAATK